MHTTQLVTSEDNKRIKNNQFSNILIDVDKRECLQEAPNPLNITKIGKNHLLYDGETKKTLIIRRWFKREFNEEPPPITSKVIICDHAHNKYQPYSVNYDQHQGYIFNLIGGVTVEPQVFAEQASSGEIIKEITKVQSETLNKDKKSQHSKKKPPNKNRHLLNNMMVELQTGQYLTDVPDPENVKIIHLPDIKNHSFLNNNKQNLIYRRDYKKIFNCSAPEKVPSKVIIYHSDQKLYQQYEAEFHNRQTGYKFKLVNGNQNELESAKRRKILPENNDISLQQVSGDEALAQALNDDVLGDEAFEKALDDNIEVESQTYPNQTLSSPTYLTSPCSNSYSFFYHNPISNALNLDPLNLEKANIQAQGNNSSTPNRRE